MVSNLLAPSRCRNFYYTHKTQGCHKVVNALSPIDNYRVVRVVTGTVSVLVSDLTTQRAKVVKVITWLSKVVTVTSASKYKLSIGCHSDNVDHVGNARLSKLSTGCQYDNFAVVKVVKVVLMTIMGFLLVTMS